MEMVYGKCLFVTEHLVKRLKEGEGETSGEGKDCSNRESRQTSTSPKPGRKADQAKAAACSVLTT